MKKNKVQDEHCDMRSKFWGVCCESGKKYSQVVAQKFHITMAALDPEVPVKDAVKNPFVSLMVERGGSEYLLCSLKHNSILQVNLNLFFDKGEKVTFFLKGQGVVHLSGYHVPNTGEAVAKSSEKVAVRDVSVSEDKDKLPVQVEKEQLDDVLIIEDKNKKAEKVVENSSPKEIRKRLWNSLDVSSNDDSDSDDDENEEEDDENEEEDDDDDGDVIVEEEDSVEEESPKNISKDKRDISVKRKLKKDASSPKKATKRLRMDDETSATEVIDVEDNTKAGRKSTSARKVSDEMNSSIGRTPMPHGKTLPSIQQADSPVEAVGSKKNKKAKNKAGIATTPNNALDLSVIKSTPNEQNLVKSTFVKKMPGGIEYEDIRVGNGPVAKRGKFVHVYYVGKLANNEIFDLKKVGAKPLSFKLGFGQVIKGWDIGLEGMRVGGKRKMKIPPAMGYGNTKQEKIPPNSTLYFIVELKAVT